MSPPKQRRWEVVYNDIRRRIDQGELPPGSPIQAERELTLHYDVSRNTVRTALRLLETHGIVTPPRGRAGRHVRQDSPLYWNLSTFEVEPRRDDPDQGIDAWAADMREQGRNPAETVEVSLMQARGDVTSHLRLPSDSVLVRRRRVRYADDTPVSIADTWLSEDVAKRPATSENGETIYPFLERRSLTMRGGLLAAVGLRQSYVMDIHYPRFATPDEAEVLGIAIEANPVGEVVRVGFDDDGHPFRVMVTVSPGHLISPRYIIQAKQGGTS